MPVSVYSSLCKESSIYPFVLLVMIIAKYTWCGGVKLFSVSSNKMSFNFPQLMEQERRRGLWVERLLRVQPGRRVGRPRLPHRPVSLHTHYIPFQMCFILCLFTFQSHTWYISAHHPPKVFCNFNQTGRDASRYLNVTATVGKYTYSPSFQQ